MKRKLQSMILMLFFLVIGGNAFSQGVTSASMSGTVKDAKGVTLPGASVVATHTPTGTVYSTQTRNDGRFNLPNLKIGGPYIVKVTFVGSREFLMNDINLNLGQEFTLAASLQDNAMALKEVIVSSSQDKIFNASRTGARETVTRTQIDRLPTISRSLADFTKLTPSANGSSFGGRSSSYNNVTVDGALFNNSFGLSGTLGGQTNSQPISLDAIEQIQVDIAPYDVRQGFFTGAGVNTVTKSGTNEFKATVYNYTRNPDLIGYRPGPFENSRQVFTDNTKGASFGGPIIKNKLFFFVSGEQKKEATPGTTFTAVKDGQTPGGNISNAKASDLDALKQFLITKYNYNPGVYEGYNNETTSDKVTAKLDWNINSKNTLSAKYFYLKSQRDVAPSNSGAIGNSRQPSIDAMPFNGTQYVIHNDFNIGILELNSRISNKISNKLTVGYTALRDFRESKAGALFPLVDIGNGSSKTFTSFGYEPFTANNLLSTDTYQFSDDVTIFAGKHEITIGTSNQYNKFKNGFAPTYYGQFQFNASGTNNLTDFYSSANNGATGTRATQADLRYSALADGSFPFAYTEILQLSAYVQDKFTVTPNFKLTYGVRADYSTFPIDLQANTSVEALTFVNGQKIDVSKFPSAKLLVSPRVGFNYNLNGKGETQFRGGAGLFAGQVPFVWLSNQASNNGVQFGSYQVKSSAAPTDSRLVFSPDVDAYRPTGAAANTSYNIAVTDPNFKLPQIFRVNAAVDQKLPWGLTGTLEASYTKDINAVLFQNVNLSKVSGVPLVGSDARLRYAANRIYSGAGGASAANPNISDAILFKNTDKGYSYFVTGQLQKSFTNGFFASIAYTYSKAMSVNDGGSIAQSIWRDRQVSNDPNADELGYATFYQPSRVISTVSYRKEYAKHFASSFGLTFESAANGNYSYTYRNDLNNDGLSNNDLMYVPKTSADILLIADNSADLRTSTELWNQLNAFITQDPYLSKHRGEVVKRGGALLPYFNQANFNFTQDLFVNVKGKRNTLRFTADIVNLGNLLNRSWGLYRTFNTNQPLSFKSINGATGKPEFSFPYLDNTNKIPLTSSYRINTNNTWSVQLGFRYIFN